MFDREDFDCVFEIAEADAVVADAQTELWGIDVLESLNVALTSDNCASQTVEDTYRCPLFDGAEFSLGAIPPKDFLRHTLLLRV